MSQSLHDGVMMALTLHDPGDLQPLLGLWPTSDVKMLPFWGDERSGRSVRDRVMQTGGLANTTS